DAAWAALADGRVGCLEGTMGCGHAGQRSVALQPGDVMVRQERGELDRDAARMKLRQSLRGDAQPEATQEVGVAQTGELGVGQGVPGTLQHALAAQTYRDAQDQLELVAEHVTNLEREGTWVVGVRCVVLLR